MANVDPIRRAEIGREKRTRTRAQLIAAARSLFARQAVESVTVDDVVREAGLAKGTFYVHFEDLRDGTHGGSASRVDKEAHFEKAVQLLAPIARQVLNEMNLHLLRDTGQLTESGLRRTPDGGLNAS